MKTSRQITFGAIVLPCVAVLLILAIKAILYFASNEPLIEATPQLLKLTSKEQLSTFTSITQHEYNLSIPGKFAVIETSAKKTILTNNTMTCCILTSPDDETIAGIMDSAQQPNGYKAFRKIYHTSSSDIWNIWTLNSLESHFLRMTMKAIILPATDNGKYFFEFEQRNFNGFLAGSPNKGKYYAEVFPDSMPCNVITFSLRTYGVDPDINHEEIVNLISFLNINKISNQSIEAIVTTPVD